MYKAKILADLDEIIDAVTNVFDTPQSLSIVRETAKNLKVYVERMETETIENANAAFGLLEEV